MYYILNGIRSANPPSAAVLNKLGVEDEEGNETVQEDEEGTVFNLSELSLTRHLMGTIAKTVLTSGRSPSNQSGRMLSFGLVSFFEYLSEIASGVFHVSVGNPWRASVETPWRGMIHSPVRLACFVYLF